MNARQKAKKYKKELEFLKGQTCKVNFVTDRRNVKTLGVSMSVPAELNYTNDTIDWYHTKLLCNMFAQSDEFRDAVTIEKEIVRNDEPIFRCPWSIKYTASIDILV